MARYIRLRRHDDGEIHVVNSSAVFFVRPCESIGGSWVDFGARELAFVEPVEEVESRLNGGQPDDSRSVVPYCLRDKPF